jgi:rare lipoprotein A
MGIKTKYASSCLIVLLALPLSACGNPYPEIKSVAAKPRSKEYFSEAEYGVKASPRVAISDYDTTTKAVALVPIPKPIGATTAGQAYALSAPAKSLRRGGGRLSIGKPYKVRGKWYKPADQPGYSREGKASWYGDAFHGRLTANGEIYDMNNLTAAHPTLPLPSYARVTNLANGRSLIVRINDRGPYAEGRVIDISKRVAHVLDTKHEGVGRVRVDYIGIAPVDGRDDAYLLASFRQNNEGNLQEDKQMYAALMGGAAQPAMVASAAQMPQAITSQIPEPVQAFAPVTPLQNTLEPAVFESSAMPALEPLSRPLAADGIGMKTSPFGRRLPAVPLGYQPAAQIKADRFGAIMKPHQTAPGGFSGWKAKLTQKSGGAAPVEIIVGLLPLDAKTAEYTAGLAGLGAVSLADEAGGTRITLLVPPADADAALKALWAAGYSHAFALR